MVSIPTCEHGASPFICCWCLQSRAMELETALRDEQGKVETLRQALLLADIQCEHLHHEKRERHALGDACPVEAKIKAALASTSAKTPEPPNEGT